MAKKVLVVDDSAADLANIKTVLTDAGCLVITATNGAEAIAKAKSEKPSIIFMPPIGAKWRYKVYSRCVRH